MYSSWFEYTIRKPYPFRWVTPIVVIGGTVLLVLFSLLNVAANAFDQKTIYTTDPNSTLEEQQRNWFLKPPFNWGTNLKPTCEPQLLSVGDRLFTSNLGFSYIMTDVRHANGTYKALPSIRYLQNTLQDCKTKFVRIYLRRSHLAPPPNGRDAWALSDSRAGVECTVPTEFGTFNITLELEYSTSGTSQYNYIIDYTNTTRASIWWGTRLLNAHWTGLEETFGNATPSGNRFWYTGDFTYMWNGLAEKRNDGFVITGSTTNLTSIDTGHFNLANIVAMYNNHSINYAAGAKEALQFAKVMHSLIAVDLGNNRTATNYILDDKSLQSLLNGTDDYNRQRGGLLFNSSNKAFFLYGKIPPPGNNSIIGREHRVSLNESYNKFAPLLGELGTWPATIYTEYACTLLEKKPTETMLIMILIADLVFLQAAWLIFTWVTDWRLKKHYPMAMVCESCSKGAYEGVGLKTVNSHNIGERFSTDSENAGRGTEEDVVMASSVQRM